MLVYLFKTTAEKKFAEGNDQFTSAQYSKALDSYSTAKSLWPFINNIPDFQKNKERAQSALDDLKNRPAITIYLKNTAVQEDIDILIKNIKQMDGVKDVKFISKQEALKIYQDKNKNDPLLLELVTADILPASIEIYAFDIPSMEQQSPFNILTQNNKIIETVIRYPFSY